MFRESRRICNNRRAWTGGSLEKYNEVKVWDIIMFNIMLLSHFFHLNRSHLSTWLQKRELFPQ